MPLVVKDRVRETSTTAGTGTFTLAGAVLGYQSFSAIGDGNTTYYTIYLQGGNEWEVGIGTYTASGTTLSRDTILASSNAGSAVNFSAGVKDVFVTYPAGRSVWYDSATNVTLNALTVTGALAANGGTTIGDASGDAFTINSSAVSTPNGLNFDSNTLVVDAANNRVGVGTNAPGYNLEVSTSVTAAATVLALTSTANFGYDTYLDFRKPLTVDAGTGLAGRITSQYESSNNYAITISTTGGGTNTERARLTSLGGWETRPTTNGHAVFNEDSVNADFRVESDNQTHMLFVDASADFVGIGTNNPAYQLHVVGNVNGSITSGVTNSNAGTSGIARFLALADAGNAAFGMTSSGYTDISGAADALLLNANNASNGMVFALDGVVKMKLDASSNLLVGTTTNTNSSKLVASGTISETVSSTQYLVASQFDIGTAANEIPLNQYLGNLAYQDAGSIAGPVGLGGAVTLYSGTANGVLYLNGSKVLTSGSALTFDGTNLSSTGGITSSGGDITVGTAGKFLYSNYVAQNSGSSLYLRGATASGQIEFQTNTTTKATLDSSGNLSLATNGTSFQWTNAGNNVAINGTSGVLAFYTGTSSYTERARISSDGTFRVKGAGSAGTTDAVQFSGSAPANSLILDSSGVLKENGYAVVSQADIGTAPNEVPLNQYLGTMAYQDGTNYFNTVSTVAFRNRIINGGMGIDQRNAGASFTPAEGAYGLDRYLMSQSPASKYTCQQNAGSVTPPVGFINYMGLTSTSAYSLGSVDFFGFQQRIEGVNAQDFAWNTSAGKTVTLSFWVRSSLTGPFGGSVRTGDFSASYVFRYTINTANTWEYKTVTIPAPTTGSVNTGTGQYCNVVFAIACGSGYTAQPGSWQALTGLAPPDQTNLVGTNGATFYITGIQLELGTQATPFDWRPYTTELQLCQRYFEKSFAQATAPANGANTSSLATEVNTARGYASGSTGEDGFVTSYKVIKRTSPTLTLYGNSLGEWLNTSGVSAGVTIVAAGDSSFAAYQTLSTTIQALRGHWTASAEL